MVNPINLNFGVVLEEIQTQEQTNIYKDYEIINKLKEEKNKNGNTTRKRYI
jgi:hypothetical protein